MKLNVTCKICGEICANFKGLSTHLRKHNCEAKDYYDTYLKTDPNEGKCVSCGKETKFYRMSCGYYKHCSDKCSANDKNTREKCKNTNIKRYGYENPWNDKNEHKLAKEGFLKKYGVENPGQVP